MYGFLAKRLCTSWIREKHSPRHGSVAPVARRVPPSLEILETRIVPSSSNWSMYNYDSAGTRDNTAESSLSPSNVGGLQVLWSFPTKGVVTGTPAVVSNAVYAGDTAGNFYAVTRSGQLLWQTQVNGPVTDSPLVVGYTVIFCTLGDETQGTHGTVYGLDAKTGKALWETQPQSNPASSLWGSATLVGSDVAIGVGGSDTASGRGSLVLLNPSTGQIIWQTSTISDADYANGVRGAAIWSTPAYDPALNLIYAGTGNNYGSPTNGTSDAMIAFSARDGHIVWVNQRTSGDTGVPDYDFGDSPHLYTLASGETVVGSGQKSGFYHVFDRATGALVNSIQVVPAGGGGLFASAAVDRTTAVVFANADHPQSSGPATGDLVAIAGDGSHVVWDFPTPTPDLSGVALANGVVYFQDVGGTFYALNEKTGALLVQLSTGGAWSGPAISRGELFLGQGDVNNGYNSPGGIVALGLSKSQRKGNPSGSLLPPGPPPNGAPGGPDNAWTMPSSISPMPVLPITTAPASSATRTQGSDALFQAFAMASLSQEFNRTATDPQPFSLLPMLNANLGVLEDGHLGQF